MKLSRKYKLNISFFANKKFIATFWTSHLILITPSHKSNKSFYRFKFSSLYFCNFLSSRKPKTCLRLSFSLQKVRSWLVQRWSVGAGCRSKKNSVADAKNIKKAKKTRKSKKKKPGRKTFPWWANARKGNLHLCVLGWEEKRRKKNYELHWNKYLTLSWPFKFV